GAAGIYQTSIGWNVTGVTQEDTLGNSVASAGDVNGDGYGDVIVGMENYDNSQVNEGRALVYLGGTVGPTTTAAWSAESNEGSSHFGRSVASAGDVNGDGYGDVIVGAPDHGTPLHNAGAAYVYLGSATGLALDPAWMVKGDRPEARFGYSVASAGDVNGDGYGDIIVGAA